MTARLLKLGIQPSGADPGEFAQIIRDEEILCRDAIKAAGVKPEAMMERRSIADCAAAIRP